MESISKLFDLREQAPDSKVNKRWMRETASIFYAAGVWSRCEQGEHLLY
jgi:hypothetical protein